MKGFYQYEKKYVRNGEKSFLLVSIPIEDEIKQYQIQMIEKNTVKKLLPLSVQRMNDQRSLYYNITSRIPLDRILERKRLNAKEFEYLITQMTGLAREMKDYMLDINRVVLDKSFIFCEPSDLTLYFLYCPFGGDEREPQRLKDFFRTLIVEDIRLADDESGNLLKRILEAIKQEDFSPEQLSQCVHPLENIEGKAAIKNIPEKTKDTPVIANDMEVPFRKGIILPEIEKVRNSPSISWRLSYPPTSYLVTGGVNLLLLGILIVSLSAKTKDPVSTSMGLLLVAGAVNYFLFSRLFSKDKRIDTAPAAKQEKRQPFGTVSYVNNALREEMPVPAHAFRKEHISDTFQSEPVPQEMFMQSPPQFEQRQETNKKEIRKEIPWENTGISEQEYPIADKTMVLGMAQEQTPYLQSHRCPTERIPLDKPSILIGRLTDSVDYVVDNKAVGKIHAEIIKKENTYHILDLNSVNGTYINDERIVCSTEKAIRHGDRITLANEHFTFFQ